ncbi:hypothetical protein FKW77_009918 [Venturia effusa]|uniref:Uncharacterized protein n=1 Tax=Venturia effusa TaxID=50376 RepID=A0A517LA17_9PEZI|nr:hypothetical protein FKW77_009918 [Venturia effusa]
MGLIKKAVLLGSGIFIAKKVMHKNDRKNSSANGYREPQSDYYNHNNQYPNNNNQYPNNNNQYPNNNNQYPNNNNQYPNNSQYQYDTQYPSNNQYYHGGPNQGVYHDHKDPVSAPVYRETPQQQIGYGQQGTISPASTGYRNHADQKAPSEGGKSWH